MSRIVKLGLLLAVAGAGFFLGSWQSSLQRSSAEAPGTPLQVQVESIGREVSEVSLFVLPRGEAHVLDYDPVTGRYEAMVTAPPDARLLLANAYHGEEVVAHGVATLPVSPAPDDPVLIRLLTEAAPPAEEPPFPLALENAVEQGLRFLADTQLAWGEFGAEWCGDRWLDQNCRPFKSSTFPTAFVVYALFGIDHPLSHSMTEAALEFLRSEERPDGSWPYWSSRAEDMPGDVDTTAMVAYVLKRGGFAADSEDLLWDNRNESGVLWTWFDDFPFENDIDCVVNANALLYLDEDPTVCRFVKEALRAGTKCSIYYEDELDLTYAASRAFREGAACLGAARGPMIEAARRRLAEPGPSALEASLALNTLLNLEYEGPEVDEGIERLLSMQNADGGWRAEGLYCVDCRDPVPRYFGSRELTTGLVLEALSKYRGRHVP